MELKKLFKKLLTSTCIVFTVLTMVYMLLLQITNIEDTDAAVQAGRVLLFFVFSLMLSIANTAFSIEKLHLALRYIIHYAITVFGFWTCICLPLNNRFSTTLVAIVAFSIIYAITMLLISIFGRRMKKNKKNEIKYEKQFSNKKR